jgi:hypothetical protein
MHDAINMDVRSIERRSSRFLLGSILTFIALSVFGGATAYLYLFSMFREYDDEGYLLETVRHVLDGQVLYDAVRTPYGPLYFLWQELLHSVLRVPLSNDAVRFVTLGFWLATAWMCAFAVWRLSRNVAMGALAFLVAFLHLKALANEPGHPQELAAALIGLCILLPTFALGNAALAALPMLIAQGILCSALCLVKTNVGVFMTLSLLFANVLAMEPGRLRSTLVTFFGLMAVALPWVLMRKHIASAGGQPYVTGARPYVLYASVVSLSVLSVAAVAVRRRGDIRATHLLAFFASFLAAALLIGLSFMLKGTTLHGMYDAMVVMPQRLAASFGFVPPFGAYRNWATLSALVTIMYVLGRIPDAGIQLVKGALAVCIVVASIRWKPGINLNIAPLFLWVFLVPATGRTLGAREYYARVVMVCIAVLQSLQAYPVPGTQLYIGTFVMVPIACIGLVDSLQWPVLASRPYLPRLISTVLIALVVVYSLRFLCSTARTYRAGVPLQLAGAQRLRLPPERVVVLRELATTLHQYSSTFLDTAGFNSLYLWTGKQPPNQLVIGSDIQLFTPQEQHSMIVALLEHPDSMIVRQPGIFGPLPSSAPFFQDIDREFRVWRLIGPFELMVPKNSTLRP